MAWPPEGAKLGYFERDNGAIEIFNQVNGNTLLTVRGYNGATASDFLAWIVSLQKDLQTSRNAPLRITPFVKSDTELGDAIREAQAREDDVKEHDATRTLDAVLDSFGKKAGEALDSASGRINQAFNTFESKLKSSKLAKLLKG